jgi:hypothetical protein
MPGKSSEFTAELIQYNDGWDLVEGASVWKTEYIAPCRRINCSGDFIHLQMDPVQAMHPGFSSKWGQTEQGRSCEKITSSDLFLINSSV